MGGVDHSPLYNRDRVKTIIFIRTNSNPADTDIFWHWLYSPELQDSQQLDKQNVFISSQWGFRDK